MRLRIPILLALLVAGPAFGERPAGSEEPAAAEELTRLELRLWEAERRMGLELEEGFEASARRWLAARLEPALRYAGLAGGAALPAKAAPADPNAPRTRCAPGEGGQLECRTVAPRR